MSLVIFIENSTVESDRIYSKSSSWVRSNSTAIASDEIEKLEILIENLTTESDLIQKQKLNKFIEYSAAKSAENVSKFSKQVWYLLKIQLLSPIKFNCLVW